MDPHYVNKPTEQYGLIYGYADWTNYFLQELFLVWMYHPIYRQYKMTFTTIEDFFYMTHFCHINIKLQRALSLK